MMKKFLTGCILFPLLVIGQHNDYRINPVKFTDVALNDDFWMPKIKTNHEVTIPIAFQFSETTGRIKNFEVAGGLTEGTFCTTYPFDDSDVFKIMEGAAYSLQTFPDAELEAYLDSLIYKVGKAQEEDGYLYTNRTILGDSGHPWIGTERWQNTHLHSHELYNIGHMYEAAVAHYLATGKKDFLDIAMKSADLADKDFGWDAKVSYPGHQEIEIGLVKLYRVTQDERYLELAKFFLDARNNGEEYCQAHIPVTEQTEATGHAVRATYMYSGMADVAALKTEQAYVDAISKIWEDITYKNIYVTGGIGATGGNEGFGADYDLPNKTAYCETCASIGNIFFNHRLFLLYGDAKYYDVLERTLYNAMLSGVSVSGDRFFYPNVLESDGSHQRKEWFGCACCPSNIARFLPSVPGYIYATDEGSLYINLYISNTSRVSRLESLVSIKSGYPYDGHILIEVNPDKPKRFSLKLRIPGWAMNEAIPGNLYTFRMISDQLPVIMLNGEDVDYEMDKGYALINRRWKEGDLVELHLPMPVREVIADKRVKADSGRIAIQRGPLVYCAEHPDNALMNWYLHESPIGQANEKMSMHWGVTNRTLPIKHRQSTINTVILQKENLRLIPYHLWNNRGPGKMMVWIKEKANTK